MAKEEVIRGDTATPEEWSSANEKLGDLEYSGTVIDKLNELKSTYDSLSPEQKSRLREALKEIVKVL
ncbi:MAG: hypothetical protein Q8Q89_01845 [bacterium]|nr:hypothetical protein [bacterium]